MTCQIIDRKIQKIMKTHDSIIKKLGLETAKSLTKRLNQLEATNNFKEFLDSGLGKPHLLKGDLKGLCGINLDANRRLIIEPVSEKLDDESLRKCEEFVIKGVVDYHGEKYEWVMP